MGGDSASTRSHASDQRNKCVFGSLIVERSAGLRELSERPDNASTTIDRYSRLGIRGISQSIDKVLISSQVCGCCNGTEVVRIGLRLQVIDMLVALCGAAEPKLDRRADHNSQKREARYRPVIHRLEFPKAAQELEFPADSTPSSEQASRFWSSVLHRGWRPSRTVTA